MKHQKTLGEYLHSFFVTRLKNEMGASENTIEAYKYAFSLLLEFVETRQNKSRHKLMIEDVDDRVVGEFLSHLEVNRKNGARTRNARLASIKSFFKFVSVKDPALVHHSHRIISIQQKRFESRVISYLNEEELTAMIDAADRSTVVGRRDAIIIKLMAETGIRVSELTNLRIDKCHLGLVPEITVLGKGGNERSVLISKTMAKLVGSHIDDTSDKHCEYVFTSYKKQKLSRDAIEQRVKKYAALASKECKSLSDKRVTPHVFRHSKAMTLLKNNQGRTMIKLWLGHKSIKSSEPYIHADTSMMEQGLIAVGNEIKNQQLERYKPDNDVFAFLQTL